MKKLITILVIALTFACSTEEDVYTTSTELGIYNRTNNDMQFRITSGSCSISSQYYTVQANQSITLTDECILDDEDDYNFTPYQIDVVSVDSNYTIIVTKIKSGTKNFNL